MVMLLLVHYPSFHEKEQAVDSLWLQFTSSITLLLSDSYTVYMFTYNIQFRMELEGVELRDELNVLIPVARKCFSSCGRRGKK